MSIVCSTYRSEVFIHTKDSDGEEFWYDEIGNSITEEEFNKIWEKVE